MTIPYFEVAAFTNRPFSGNPAGVCVLEAPLSDTTMQAIAAENNMAETAFFSRRNDRYDLRWMTPIVEMDLCGHATLASAHVILQHLGGTDSVLRFESRSGTLTVERNNGRLVLDFPSRPASECQTPPSLTKGLGAAPTMVLKGRDYLAVFERAEDVAGLSPDFDVIAQLDANGVIATAPGDDCDFVSRYFAPKVGIPEDPVTGSTHCALIPFWSRRLGKKTLFARQISKRGGELFCEDRDDRVGIGGQAITYVEGKIHCPTP